MSRMSIPTLFIAGLVVLILVAFACTYQVAFNQVAVKVRFGKADASSIIREPGLKLRWPWPIESIETYDTRVRTLDTPETEIKTSDGKNLIVGAYAVWAIADPLHFYKRVRSAGEAEKQMRSRLSQSQAAVIGQSTLADFVNLDVRRRTPATTGCWPRCRPTRHPASRRTTGSNSIAWAFAASPCPKRPRSRSLPACSRSGTSWRPATGKRASRRPRASRPGPSRTPSRFWRSPSASPRRSSPRASRPARASWR